MITVYKPLHPRDDIDRTYILRKGGRELACIEDSGDASIWIFDDCIETSKERLITAASNRTDNIMTNRTTIKTRKQK